MIAYTCPKCSHDLQEIILTSLPPQHKIFCVNCGWSHTTKEEIYKIPYNIEDISNLVEEK